MSYVALYRKWRPDNFDEVKGQEHIVTTLRNQVKNSRVGHAYLFCGTRGTGKTTLAKILAKAVNCEHPVNGSPCNECESCKRIANGQATNVIEIDAASNNGVDNIRQIQSAVGYNPSGAKKLVYIIDEVHMLSSGAFNALLKTLEEPPEYVVFILATTESHKIPATILSRCQRYDFKRIQRETIADRLGELLDREQVAATREALMYIAGAADGSMRDALSILDQCIAFNLGEELTYDRVLDTIGSVDIDIYIKLFKAIYNEDATKALGVVDDVIYEGRDISQFVNELITFVRNLLVIKLDPNLKVELTKENVEKLVELGQEMNENYLIDYINILQEWAAKISQAYVKRVMLEVMVIKLCKPAMHQGYDAIERRLDDLEKKSEIYDEKLEHGMPNVANISPEQLQMLAANSEIVQAVSESKGDGQNKEGQSEKEKLRQIVTHNIETKYEKAKVHELKLIAAMSDYIGKHLVAPANLFFEKAKLMPTSEIGRLDMVLEDIPENKLGIEYFKKEYFLKILEENIAEITNREVKVTFKTVSANHNQEDVDFWDIKKVDFGDIQIEKELNLNKDDINDVRFKIHESK